MWLKLGPGLLTAALVATSGCAVYSPPANPPADFMERAIVETDGDVSVSAVVLSDSEAQQVFDAPLAKNDMQALWLEIDNRSDDQLTVNFLAIDDGYFAPAEAAHQTRRFRERRSDEKFRYFYEQHLPLFIAPRTARSGYVFTNHDPGAKAFTVQLLGDRQSHSMDFVMAVPGFEADFMISRPESIYPESELSDLDAEGLRAYIESLPCCALGGDQETPGDPLNIVIVGNGVHVAATLVRRGWDLTETTRLGTAWRTVVSSVFGSRYRTSPVSPLYLFDRPQDGAFQKARATVDERNHMRLWRAPVNFQGRPVWIGQISRDIGVKLSGKTLVTHRIDSLVDEARMYLSLDLLQSGYLEQFGHASGVGLSSFDNPRYNFTRDPYYTDGLRAVIFLSDYQVPADEMVLLDWESPSRAAFLD